MANDFGYYSGLAVRNNVGDQINDIRSHDQIMRQNQALAEAKAELFANSVKYQNAMNSFDNPIIKQKNRERVLAIGRYQRENPDWKTNPDKRVQLDEMLRELQDNPDTLRGYASDKSFKEMDAYLSEVQKNPNAHNQKAIADMKLQKENYLKYGNQYGLEAASKNGLQPFMWERPKDFIDLAKNGQELGNNFKALKPVPLKNGRSGAWITEVDENALNRDAIAYYNEHKEQFDQQHPENPIAAAKEFIRSGIKTDWNYGDNHFAEQLALMRAQHAYDMDKLKAKAGNGASNIDYYVDTILKPKRTAEDPKRLADTFGSKIKHTISNDNGTVNIDNTGDVFNYNGDIQDQNYAADKEYKPNGVKTVSGYVYKPLDWGKANGVIVDPFGRSGVPDLEGTDYSDYEIDGNWRQTASIVSVPSGKDGKTTKMLKLKVKADVNATSPGYQGKYNSLVATTDQRNSTTYDRNAVYGNQNRATPSNVVYKASKGELESKGWSEDQIRQAVQQGFIELK